MSTAPSAMPVKVPMGYGLAHGAGAASAKMRPVAFASGDHGIDAGSGVMCSVTGLARAITDPNEINRVSARP